MPTRKVKWFNSQRGYGFIEPEGGRPDIFIHISAVERAGLSGLNEGQRVTFDTATERGKKTPRTSSWHEVLSRRLIRESRS